MAVLLRDYGCSGCHAARVLLLHEGELGDMMGGCACGDVREGELGDTEEGEPVVM